MSMKYVCLLIFVSSPLLGAISPEVIKASALKHHPSVQAAIERLEAGLTDGLEVAARARWPLDAARAVLPGAKA